MKKLRAFLCIVIISVSMVSSVSADSGSTSGTSWFTDLYKTVVAAVAGGDDCEDKYCQNCKPWMPFCRPNPD